jgi:hypothetical protein
LATSAAIEEQRVGLNEDDLLERAIETLIERNLGWKIADCLGSVRYD